ncbi:hypothetical protein PgNI_05693 [Pyricularia grisea]|uniref:Uncharacterized protein n=1 Tax=Pyricularia grisea TaxID=148305 RepID=A0A6P8B7W2_PYRGI|nr:hypothetical protein PgNI_05693 [Pyricularia grisea]TLD11209.1 hypothetical protein PgNI_05693 [Pyricularia grisea]
MGAQGQILGVYSGGQAINGAHPWFRVLRAAGSRPVRDKDLQYGNHQCGTLSQLRRGRVSDGR